LTYRIIFGLIDLNMSDYFTLQSSSGYSRPTTTRGNPYKLLVNHCRINARTHFFSQRIIRVWNSLPPSIVSFESLLSFKNSLGMPTSVYTPNTDRCFLLSLYLVFKLLLFLCVLLLYVCFGDCVACKWRYPPFVTLILNK